MAGTEGGEAGISRRRILQLAGLAGVGAALGGRALLASDDDLGSHGGRSPGPSAPTPSSPRAAVVPDGVRRWSDPATWGGQVPGRDDVAVVAEAVYLDIDAGVAGVTVEPAGSLVFDTANSRTLESRGNVVVRGRLEAHPESAAVIHRLAFVEVDERRFVGGGDDVIDTDVGLWVMDDGLLDTAGTPKRAWTRTTGAVAQGATRLELQDDPGGWQVGDEIAIVPTISPGSPDHDRAYDYATVTAIEARTVTLDVPTGFEHPAVDLGAGTTGTAEVLNLSRNVVIEGSAGGRAHVMVHASRPQTLRHTLLRHLGPRQVGKESDDDKGEKGDAFVPGRYALHLHRSGEGARGSLVEGSVGRDCGSHVFVTHSSHGVTWRDCISHDTVEAPFWWDLSSDDDDAAANDVAYDHCVASAFRPGSPADRRLGGFLMGAGDGNSARGCVAVGGQGGGEGSGFNWLGDSKGVWRFEDCRAHNMRKDGVFVWQNSHEEHVITRYLGFHNGGFGIDHGSYLNQYQYLDAVLVGNLAGAVNVKALSQTKAGILRFSGLSCDSAGLSDFAVVVPNHTVATETPTEFIGCSFRGYRNSAFQFQGGGSDNPHLFDVVDCTYSGNEFWLASDIPPESVIRVRDQQRGPVSLQRVDLPGEPRPQWNASANPAIPFVQES